MKENKLLLSEFANEEGFELNSYLTHLFEYFSSLSKTEAAKIEPTPWIEIEGWLFFCIYNGSNYSILPPVQQELLCISKMRKRGKNKFTLSYYVFFCEVP